MKTGAVIIPQKLARKSDLVVFSLEEYYKLLGYRLRKTKEIQLTVAQKKRLQTARENLLKGKTVTLNELKAKLGVED